MANVIKRNKHDKNIGFACSISNDFYHPRHMSVVVEVAFKEQFGKPKASPLLNSHLAIQHSQNSADVNILITKATLTEDSHA